MPTLAATPAWYYFMTGNDILGLGDGSEGNLLEMVSYIQDDQTLEHFKKVTDEYLGETAEFDPDAEAKLEMVLKATSAAALRLINIEAEYNVLRKEKQRAQDVLDTLKQVALYATINGSFDGKVVNGTKLKVATTPGRLVAKNDPDPSSPHFAEYEQFVKQKFTWDIMGLKTALAEGVIDKGFLDDLGIEFIREKTLKEL